MKFEKYVLEANGFMKGLSVELGTSEDTDHAYRVASAVFQVLREIIMPEQSLHLISQLPMFLKAMYVNGWELHVKDRVHTMPEFLERLRLKSGKAAMHDFADDETAKSKVRCVLKMLKTYLSPGETEDIINQFPIELLELWATRANISA